MKEFVEAFDKLLTREQVRHLISKLIKEKFLIIFKAQKYTKYILNNEIFNFDENIYYKFVESII